MTQGQGQGQEAEGGMEQVSAQGASTRGDELRVEIRPRGRAEEGQDVRQEERGRKMREETRKEFTSLYIYTLLLKTLLVTLIVSWSRRSTAQM